MIGLLKNPWTIGAAAAALLAIGAGLYVKGRVDGRALAENDGRQAVFDQIKERNDTDDTVRRMSAGDLCRVIGGVYHNGRCL